MYPRRKQTQTSAFGTPGRINHDSSRFYNSKLYQGLSEKIHVQYVENDIPPEVLNKIFCKSSERMEEIPDNSVHLMVTSPPYNVGKEYDEDLSLDEYRTLLKKVFSEVYRVLVTGGRACINVANLGRKPYIPLHSYIIEDALKIGFLMRGEIIWDKASSASPSTAWGSYLSPSNPCLRDIHEYILVFSKETFKRKTPTDRASTISRDEFLELTKSVWRFPAERANKVGHPAPFPVELPYRLIQLYTYEKEIVLDPFMGSGATAVAALSARRNYVGYDIDQEYVCLSERRIREYYESTSQIRLEITTSEAKDERPNKAIINKPHLRRDYSAEIAPSFSDR
jgi:site-specific DNA-methyltransferase (adenine-specific)